VLTIDASVLVAASATDEPAHEPARAFLEQVLTSGAAIHQPVLAWVEVTAGIARKTGDAKYARSVGLRAFALPGAIVHDLDTDAAAVAAGLASDLRLRAADAVYAATALTHDTILVTIDQEILVRAVSVIQVCTPADWLARQ
jgi:predicted nucleic acid-binding protein